MRADVANYVRKCRTCAAHKPDQKKPSGLMAEHPKPSQPYEILSSDLMGPLPRSHRGYRYILVIQDYFSKFCSVFPLRTASADALTKKIEEEVFLMFGVLRLFICDNGKQYRSTQFRRMLETYKCKIKYTGFYHPQADPTERYNRTLKTMISMFVSENHRTWDVNLARLACATRTAKHDSTRLSPYFVNFGRRMILCGEDFNKGPIVKGESEESVPKDEAMLKMFKDVRRRLQEASKKAERVYNLRRRHVEFLPNQAVWKRNFVLSDASKYYNAKLAPKYVGPYYIKRKISPWMYELYDEKGKSVGIWSTKDLKTSE